MSTQDGGCYDERGRSGRIARPRVGVSGRKRTERERELCKLGASTSDSVQRETRDEQCDTRLSKIRRECGQPRRPGYFMRPGVLVLLYDALLQEADSSIRARPAHNRRVGQDPTRPGRKGNMPYPRQYRRLSSTWQYFYVPLRRDSLPIEEGVGILDRHPRD